ncbi:MAG: VOC family protein, partial [Actinomycetota bacterium]
MAELDHLVLVVPDLVAAIDRFESELGVLPDVGGRHVGLGTWNALLALTDDRAGDHGAIRDPQSYLELIAVDPDQPTPDGPRPFGIDDDTGPRLATYAVRPSADESLDDLVAGLRRVGHDPGDAVPMSRSTPDGTVLSWRLTFPTGVGHGLVPFLIDWGDTPMPSRTVRARAELASFTGGT